MTDTDTATSMATTEDWAKLEKAAQAWGSLRCLLDLRRRVGALEQQRATPAPEPAQEWIERRIYKNSIEYSEYIKQRFQDRTSLSFVFDCHRWQYRYSSFDDAGDYDLIFRPSVPKPAPAPAADRSLWEVMRDAFTFSDAISLKWSAGYSTHVCYAAEIDVIADWLAAREHCGAASALRIEARRARERSSM